ncbi:MAG TPA: hypothetical protein VF698_00065, partial [Thermoanaerobaculia bacterium]
MRILPVVLSLILSSTTALAATPSHRAKAAHIPDFLQTDREAGFANSGTQFCAPTAVSNSLVWLAAHGYDDLSPAGGDKRAQITMIRELSKAMNTSPSIGTDATQLLKGVEAYVTDAGYSIAELSHEGWRPVPEDYRAGEFPDLDDIRNAIADAQSAVWLNVGWYTYDEDSGDYLRTGGHWVTVVGYIGDDLLIHDPSPLAGSTFRTQQISLEELTEGRLTGKQANLPRDAAGYYEVGGQ